MADPKPAAATPKAVKLVKVCLPITIEHDGKTYPPGTEIEMEKGEADRLAARFGTLPNLGS